MKRFVWLAGLVQIVASFGWMIIVAANPPTELSGNLSYWPLALTPVGTGLIFMIYASAESNPKQTVTVVKPTKKNGDEEDDEEKEPEGPEEPEEPKPQPKPRYVAKIHREG